MLYVYKFTLFFFLLYIYNKITINEYVCMFKDLLIIEISML